MGDVRDTCTPERVAGLRVENVANMTQTCMERSMQVMCARECAVGVGPVFQLCESECDALHSACASEDDALQDDAWEWCGAFVAIHLPGVRMYQQEDGDAHSHECWRQRPVRRAQLLRGAHPLQGWSSQDVVVALRDSHNNLYVGQTPQVRVRLASMQSEIALEQDAATMLWRGSYTLFQQLSDTLSVWWGEQRLLKLTLKVSPSAHAPPMPCVGRAPPQCPEYEGRCCLHQLSSAVLHEWHTSVPHSSPTCEERWRRLACAAQCESRATLHGSALAVAPQACTALQRQCRVASHCPSWSLPGALRLHVSGEVSAWQGEPRDYSHDIDVTKSSIEWSGPLHVTAGTRAAYRVIWRDAWGRVLPELGGHSPRLDVVARHLVTLHAIRLDGAAQPLTRAGPYTVRASFKSDGRTLLHDSAVMLWVEPALPQVPLHPHCADVFGNVNDCDALRRRGAQCAMTQVQGHGLYELGDVNNVITVTTRNVLGEAVGGKQLDVQVTVDGVVLQRNAAGVLQYPTRDRRAVLIEVTCGGAPVPGSPWKAVRPKQPLTASRELNEHMMALVAAPRVASAVLGRQAVGSGGVTALTVRMLASGRQIEVQWDGATDEASCQGLVTIESMAPSSCWWSTPSSLMAVFTFVPPLDASVMLAGDRVLPAGNALAPSAPPQTLRLLPPLPIPSVRAAMSLPTRVLGTQLLLDASASSGLVGRPQAATYRWTVVPEQGSLVPAEVQQAVAAARTSRVMLRLDDASTLEYLLTFQVNVTSWLNAFDVHAPLTVRWQPSSSASSSSPSSVRVLGADVVMTSPLGGAAVMGTNGDVSSTTTALHFAWAPRAQAPFVSPSLGRILSDTSLLRVSSSLPTGMLRIRYGVAFGSASHLEGMAQPFALDIQSAQASLGVRRAALRFPRSSPLWLDVSNVSDVASSQWQWSCDGCFQSTAQTAILSTTSALLYVPPGYLAPGTHVFEATSGSLTVGVVVTALLEEAPVVSVEVVPPAPLLVVAPSNRLLLRSSAQAPYAPCGDCRAQWPLRYRWSSSLATLDLTDQTESYLQLPPNTLPPGGSVTFSVCVSNSVGSGCASLVLQVDEVPVAGECEVDAQHEVGALVCQGWSVRHAPLLYRFGQGASLAFSTANTLPPLRLSSAPVTVWIQSAFGAQVEVEVRNTTAAQQVPVVEGSMARLVAQDRLVAALRQCDDVEAWNHIVRFPRTAPALASVLECGTRLEGASTQHAATLVASQEEEPWNAWSAQVEQNSLQMAVNAFTDDVNSASSIWRLLEAVAMQVLRTSAQQEVLRVDDQLTMIVVPSSSSIVGNVLNMDMDTSITITCFVPALTSCDVSSYPLAIVAALWDPAPQPTLELCSPVLSVRPLSSSSSRVVEAVFDFASSSSSSSCEQCVYLSEDESGWLHDDSVCRLVNSSQCHCQSTIALTVALARTVLLAQGGILTTAPPFLNGVQVASLIAVAAVGVVGAALLAAAAVPAIRSAMAPSTYQSVHVARADASAPPTPVDESADMMRPPALRQTVRVNPAAAVWAGYGDVEDWE